MSGAAGVAVRGPALQAARTRPMNWMGHRMSYAVGMPALTLLGMAAGLLVPRLVDPVAFGGYALLLNVFRYAARGDLGLSQLADRRLACGGDHEADANLLLRVRSLLGLMSFVCFVALALVFAWASGLVSPLDAALAAAAGSAAMVAGGPSSVFRARGWIWEYTALGFLFCIGFILPRLGGLALGGVTGCYLALLLWYAAILALFLRYPRRGVGWRSAFEALPATLVAGLPFFVFAAAWTLYASASRWFAAGLSDPQAFGLFAFAANLALTAVTTFAGIADVRYPRWLGRIAAAEPGRLSAEFARELALVALGVSLAVAAFLPVCGTLVSSVFPAYADASAAAAFLAIGCVPLAVLAWALPVAIALSPRPILHAAVVFAPSTALMGPAMALGQRADGIEGQAVACGLSALVACLGLLAVLRVERVLERRAVGAIFAAVVALVGALSTVAVAVAAPRASLSGAVAVPPSGWRLAFSDDFAKLDLWNGRSGVWEPRYPWGGRTNPTSGEREWYADPRVPAERAALGGRDTLSIVGGHLAIRAFPVSGAPAVLGRRAYASGLINSKHAFSFTYGYADIRAVLPAGRGMWPAFWLLPVDGSWPPEIDVMESIGGEGSRYWATVHAGAVAARGFYQAAVDVAARFEVPHDYGVLWTPEQIVWYLDGVATPTDVRRPMYLLVNLAVGGDWAGEPDAATPMPGEMRVERVRVFAFPTRRAAR